MRLLLHEYVPARLRKALPSHEVSTVGLEGWSGIKNVRLLAFAAAGFDALTHPSRGRPTGYALRPPFMSIVRQLTPTTSMAGTEIQQLMMFPLQDRPMFLTPY